MTDDEDPTLHFNNAPEESEKEQEPTKPRRAPRSKVSTFQAETDMICCAIQAYLDKALLSNLTHRTTFEFKGEQFAIGNSMYTLRRQSRKEDQSQIVAARLAHLSQNPKWIEFMRTAVRAPEAKTQSTTQTPQKPNLGLEGDVEKLTQCCFAKMYQLAKMRAEYDELNYVMWQSFPELRPNMQKRFFANLQKQHTNKRAKVY